MMLKKVLFTAWVLGFAVWAGPARTAALPQGLKTLEGKVTEAKTGKEALEAIQIFSREARKFPDLWEPVKDAGGPKLGIMGEPGVDGMMITKVLPASAADMEGVREGDILQSVNGTKVHEVKDVIAVLGSAPEGSALALKLLRRGEGLEKAVTPQVLSTYTGALPLPKLFPGLGKQGPQYVMFSELLCPHCGPAYKEARKRTREEEFLNGGGRFFYIPFELGFDKTGLIAQAFACMMEKPGKFVEFADGAFGKVSDFRGAAVKKNLEVLLKKSGYGPDPKVCWTSEEKDHWLETFRLLAALKGVNATPTVFKDGKRWMGE